MIEHVYCPRSTLPYRASINCSELLDMTQTCPTNMFQNCLIWSKLAQQNYSIVQNCWKFLKVSQNCSGCPKSLKSAAKLFKMFQNGPTRVHRGDVLAYTRSKLSLLGIAVSGVYSCVGLRSVSNEQRLCLLLRSEPSIVNFNWQGSLVIRLAAIVPINND